MGEVKRLYLASGNAGKLREFQALAAGHTLELQLLPGFASLPEFEENAPTFAENAAGKALYYSRHRGEVVFADDSGLVVPVLNGAPGVLSARYAGPRASNEEVAIVSARVDGEILEAPHGTSGFGYDPVFFFPQLGKSFAELQPEEKNQFSHRGKAFRRLMEVLE